MKENLDNAGVARKVATLFALPVAERTIELQLMAVNFAGWMEQNFNLLKHQSQQLDRMPIDVREQLGKSISNYLIRGFAVQFQKDEKEKEDPDYKELSTLGLELWEEPEPEQAWSPLFFRIHYRYPKQ